MLSDGSGFYLLNTRLGWQTSETMSPQNIAVGLSGGGLRLTAAAGGPLALDWPDGSLGRLTLPRGVAFDDRGVLYLLGVSAPLIRRSEPVFPCTAPNAACYEPVGVRFTPLPHVGGAGSAPRRFDQPANIAIAGHELYVADRGNHRVQVFSLAASLALHHVWTSSPHDRPNDPTTAESWDPADVASFRGAVYILDAAGHRVYRHVPGSDAPTLVVDGASYLHLDGGTTRAESATPAGAGGDQPATPDAAQPRPSLAGEWVRLALDRAGNIYVLDAQGPCLQVFSPEGRWLMRATDAGSVIGAFDPPAVVMHYGVAFRIPAHAWFALPRLPGVPEAISASLYFDLDGQPVRPDFSQPPGPASYAQTGSWVSTGLDSGLYHCQWHRIVLDVASLPLGTQITVSTAAADPDAPDFGQPQWNVGYTFSGQLSAPDPAEDQPYDLLVPSTEGQCLQLKVDLAGDGFATPEITGIRIFYPRSTYLRFLPAIYSADEDARRFLERFLAIFQTTWDGIEDTIDNSAALFDPAATPAAFIDRLAAWLGLPLEQSWTAEQKRHLLEIIPGHGAIRGTLTGLCGYLQVYLENLAGIAPQDQHGYPILIEGFRERRYVQFLAQDAAAAHDSERRAPAADRRGMELDRRARLWSREVVGRLQLDAYATIGQVRLVSTGDPRRDVFYEHAHRFRLFVPAAWVQTADAESMLRRAIEDEKPVQAAYDLRLVEPRLRVGIQSTVGVDTIVGDYPYTRLAAAGEDMVRAPSLPPRGRLGYDTILSSAVPAPLRLTDAPGIAVGSAIR